MPSVRIDSARPAPSDVPAPASSRPSQRPPVPARPAPDLERIPDSSTYLAFLTGVGTSVATSRTEAAALHETAREVEVRQRLDSFRDSLSGPYVIDGQAIAARPMFRMNGGFNDKQQRAHDAELSAICLKANVSLRAALDAKVGRPTPGELRAVTQALIDAGKLTAHDSGSLEQRIRAMQWEWGIGVDCAGYTEQAARAARAEPARRPTHGDAFSGLSRNSSMRKVDVPRIRAGDVIHLDPPARGDVGHNVVVYAQRIPSAGECALLAQRDRTCADFLANGGPFHFIDVDSSWGAGPNGADYGGYRRDTWVYDEASLSWLYFERATETFAVSTIGPHGEPYAGAFRPLRDG